MSRLSMQSWNVLSHIRQNLLLQQTKRVRHAHEKSWSSHVYTVHCTWSNPTKCANRENLTTHLKLSPSMGDYLRFFNNVPLSGIRSYDYHKNKDKEAQNNATQNIINTWYQYIILNRHMKPMSCHRHSSDSHQVTILTVPIMWKTCKMWKII